MSKRSTATVVVISLLGLVGLILVLWGAMQSYNAEIMARAPATQAPAPSDLRNAPASQPLKSSPDLIRSVMPAIISVMLLISSLAVLFRRHESPEHQRWATGMVTLIVGYWLK